MKPKTSVVVLCLLTTLNLFANDLTIYDIEDYALENATVFNDGFQQRGLFCGKKCKEQKKKEEEAKKKEEEAQQQQQQNETDEIINIFQKNQALKFFYNQFKASIALPGIRDLSIGSVWLCKTYNAFKVEGFGQVSQRERTLQFATFGPIIQNIRPNSGDLVEEYFPDVELAGNDINEELYEAIRVTENGDLVIETSIHGLTNISYFKRLFATIAQLLSGNIDFEKLIVTLKGLLSASISNTENKGLVVGYTYCPLNQIIGGGNDF